MAHTINTQVLEDGNRNTVIKVNIKGDGSSGELTNEVIFDASEYKTQSINNKLMEVRFCLNGFSAELFWAATSPVPLINLDQDISETMEYLFPGGLINNAGVGKTGDITITTNGLAASSEEGYIVFYIVQRKIPFIK